MRDLFTPNEPWFHAPRMVARLGLVARGIACIVIRTIAVMVAFGVARHEPDQAGAIDCSLCRLAGGEPAEPF
jgi:hypothetical protein